MERTKSWVKPIVAASLIFQLGGYARAAEGGVSGGGGNVMPTAPVTNAATIRETKVLIQGAHAQVVPFLIEQTELVRQGRIFGREAELLSKLLQQGDRVYQTISQRPVYIEINFPCLDLNHEAVDSCIFSPRPNTICISAKTISKKLNRKQVASQSTALLIHEYSELLGLSEPEAIELQTLVLQRLTR